MNQKPTYDELKLQVTTLKKTIAESRKRHTSLKQNEAKFAEAFFKTPIPMAITTIKDGSYTDVNKAFIDLMGLKRNELVGNTSVGTRFITAEQRLLFVEQFSKKGFVENLELQICVKGNEQRYGLFNSSKITIADEDFFLTSVTDITDLKMTQEALRKSEELSTKLIAAIPDLVVVMNTQGEIQFINDRDFQTSDYQPTDVIGKNILSFIVPEDHEKALQNLKPGAMQQNGPRIYRIVNPKGEIRLFEANGDFLKLNNGEPYSYIIILRDITDRERMERERVALQERLHRAEKMEALGTLAGGVAHDLNNVLGVLVGYSDLLRRKMTEDSPFRNYVDKILESGIRSTAIIQDLLTLSRQGVAISEVVNLNTIISNYFLSIEFEKLKEDYPGVTFKTHLDADLLNIKGSPVHLLKTLTNLLCNAAEAISGKGTITVQTWNCYLDYPIRGYDTILEGDYAILNVSDTGKGIADEDMGQIFEPFYTRKAMRKGGTGLGLAVVWGTVKDHNGYIDIQSEEGKGTDLTLYLPITREQPAQDKQTHSPADYVSKGESILIIDDVPGQRELATNMLESLGYRVESVGGGEEALKYLKNKKADLIVLDMIMHPGMDGLETYKKVLQINPKQKAVIVSGFSETDHVRQTLEMGAGTFVRKPYILEKIGMAIRSALDRN